VIDRVWRCCLVVLLVSATAARADTGATIAAGDTVSVAVAGDTRVTGRYVVDEDGAIVFPMIGAVHVSGLTADRLRGVLSERLAPFLTSPSVEVVFTPPQRVFVLGNVARPGVVELTEGMTVLEALLAIGYDGAAEVLIVRTGNARSPVLPDQAGTANVIRVNLRDFESDLASGNLSRNVRLEPGDTVFVPSLDPNNVFVSGEVNKPGTYSVPNGTTVRQVLTLAGGATKRAALGRTELLRIQNGRRQESKVTLDQQVRPGDTIVVPETFVNPVFQVGSSPEALGIRGMNSGTMPLGGNVSLTQTPEFTNPIRLGHTTLLPVVPLTAIGVDQNVFNAKTDPQSDFVVATEPKIGVKLDMGRSRVEALAGVGLVYYHTFASERSVNPSYGASMEFDAGSRTLLTVSGGYLSTRDRFNYELDERVRREEAAVSAGAEFGPWGRAKVHVNVDVRDRQLPGDPTVGSNDLSVTLNERIQKLTAGSSFVATPSTSLSVEVSPAMYRFPLYPQKNANGGEVKLGGSFKAGALVDGAASVSALQYTSSNAFFAPYEGVGWSGDLRHTWERTQVGFRGDRSIVAAFEANVAFSVANTYGGWLRQQLSSHFDTFVSADRIRNEHHGFETIAEGGLSGSGDAAPYSRYGVQLGVLIGRSRLALEASYEDRGGPNSFNNVRWNIVYNMIQVRN
jgi:polysaccharide export outer membrane protein